MRGYIRDIKTLFIIHVAAFHVGFFKTLIITLQVSEIPDGPDHKNILWYKLFSIVLSIVPVFFLSCKSLCSGFVGLQKVLLNVGLCIHIAVPKWESGRSLPFDTRQYCFFKQMMYFDQLASM